MLSMIFKSTWKPLKTCHSRLRRRSQLLSTLWTLLVIFHLRLKLSSPLIDLVSRPQPCMLSRSRFLPTGKASSRRTSILARTQKTVISSMLLFSNRIVSGLGRDALWWSP